MPLPRKPEDNASKPLCLAPCAAAPERIVAGAPSPTGGKSPLVRSVPEELMVLREQVKTMNANQQEMQATLLKMQETLQMLASGGSPKSLQAKANAQREAMQAHAQREAAQQARIAEDLLKMEGKEIAPEKDAATFQVTEQKATEADITRPMSNASLGSDGISKRMSKSQLAAENAEKTMLLDLFLEAEAIQARDEAEQEAKKNMWQYYKDKIKYMTQPQFEMILDSVMGFVICLNAVFIGISMDYGETTVGWILADSTFSVIFIIEISIKCKMHGCKGHFCGPSWKSNCFDASLVFIDLVQLALLICVPSAAESTEDLPSASLFRMIRLIKLTRLLRLLRNEVFKDLLSMIQGMLGGMTTLCWSMILFFLMVYIISLLFREFFGRKKVEHVYDFFNNVPRSMFTTFRCSFGDCSTAGGMPIFEWVQLEYGAVASVFYCLFVFAVTIGLFNVISAIFVESTMVAAMSLEVNKKKARLADVALWNSRIATLIARIMDVSPDHTIPGQMSNFVEEIFKVDVAGTVIDKVVKDPEARAALDDLDIDQEDFAYLSDILDPDNGGTIGVSEFIDGLRRLRGDPRRSDIVSVDLMIRSIQQSIDDIQFKVSELFEGRMSVDQPDSPE